MLRTESYPIPGATAYIEIAYYEIVTGNVKTNLLETYLGFTNPLGMPRVVENYTMKP